MQRYLADTTVLIDHLRGDKRAIVSLKENLPSISQVTVAELIQGVSNKRELSAVEQAISDLQIIPISSDISLKAINFMRKFFLSKNFQFLDALIAATAIERSLTLVTANIKHFKFIRGLKLKGWQ